MLIIACMAGVALLSSCLKDEDVQPIPAAGLTMVNSFIESQSVIYGIDGRAIQNNFSPLTYRHYGFIEVYARSNRRLEVYASGNQNQIQLVDTTFAVRDSVFYSSFVYGTGNMPQHFLTEDRVPAGTTDPTAIAAVRFFNLANTPHRVTLKIGETDPVPAFGNRPTETPQSGKAGEDFVVVPTGTYEVTVEDEDGTTLASRTGIALSAGSYTTIFLTGAEATPGSYYVGVARQWVN